MEVKLFSDTGRVWYRRVKNSIKVLIGREIAIPIVKDGIVNICPVCNIKGVDFYPISQYYSRQLFENQCIHPLFQVETINIEFYTCSNCGATDRDRLYALYFNHFLKNGGNFSVLDVAPSYSLSKYLRSITNLSVRTADLYMPSVDDKVDITDMNIYADESFDILICSHVLEHIPNDLKAMIELYRVLKKGGWGIVMVPILLSLDTIYEDFSVTDESGRWKHFGQNDHVRMYSKSGFVSRLESVGFRVRQLDANFFGEKIFKVHGIQGRSVLYIVEK
ncbi:MAG: class I SAM-dependent methyltransferase [Cyclobacteriaceae bacterium]|nr:class I SAM-dependent methyltransferase [Cyclobacteriaceae bacterium]